jgi:hypothetical protein
MARGRRRHGYGSATVALLICATVCAVAAGSAHAAEGRFFVPTGERTGFGAFQESPDSAGALRRAFGPPTTEKPGDFGSCVQAWPRLGVVVTLAAFGSVTDACTEGSFYEARLTDPRWHTATGVHPGGSRASARRAALRRCSPLDCGITGYALELHRTDCSSTPSAGVIAHVRGSRIASLIVRWRLCE